MANLSPRIPFAQCSQALQLWCFCFAFVSVSLLGVTKSFWRFCYGVYIWLWVPVSLSGVTKSCINNVPSTNRYRGQVKQQLLAITRYHYISARNLRARCVHVMEAASADVRPQDANFACCASALALRRALRSFASPSPVKSAKSESPAPSSPAPSLIRLAGSTPEPAACALTPARTLASRESCSEALTRFWEVGASHPCWFPRLGVDLALSLVACRWRRVV